MAYAPPVRALADPWVTLAAVAVATSTLVIGPLVTPLPRRRTHQLARETVTLDRLSGGRLVLGVGIGSDATGEFDPGRFGEEPDARARAELLDDGLERLQSYWDGEFEPRPVGRIPIWVAARWPNRRPVRRAARFDGLFPIDLPGPEALAELAAEVAEQRGPGPLRPRRHQPGRHRSGALDRGGRHLVPDRLRVAADRGRGARRDRLRRPLTERARPRPRPRPAPPAAAP